MDEESRWLDLIDRLARVETQLTELAQNHLPHLRQELTWVKERLNRGYRPPWSVVALITLLTSACVGLLLQLVQH